MSDATNGNPDADMDPPDAGPADRGPRDTGPMPDSGPPDSGPMNADQEGGPCTPGATDQGSCLDPTNVCVTWSPEGFMPQISTCIRPCEADMDCANSPAGNVCGNVIAGLEGGVVVGIKACVSALVGEGETANLSERLGQPMTGCADPYQAYPWFIGSLLFLLEDDQASCGLPCGSNADCTDGRPNAPTPFCSNNVLNPMTATVTAGICQTRQANKGARCSQATIIEMCDTSTSSNMVCVDLGMNETSNMVPGQAYGVCLEVCDMTNPACPSKISPNLPDPTCEFNFFTSPTLGVCDDGCDAFPDNCQGTGSPAPAGGTQNGIACSQFGGTFDAPNQGLCVDVAQTQPLFDVWDFGNPPAIPCFDEVIRCPDETSCIGVDLGGGQSTSACVFGCNTATATTGCSGHMGFPVCNAVFGATTESGVCQTM